VDGRTRKGRNGEADSDALDLPPKN
jgi:hypothetical protein